MQSKNKSQLAVRVLFLIAVDILLINLSSYLALFIRYDFSASTMLSTLVPHDVFVMLGVNTICTLIIFGIARLYNSLWSFAGIDELMHIAAASAVAAVITSAIGWAFDVKFPRSYPLIHMTLLFVLITAFRFSYRYFRRYRKTKEPMMVRTMIVGAGLTGDCVLREMQSGTHSVNKVVCLIDDDPLKVGKYMHGVRIVGNRTTILQFAKEYRVKEIIIAMPTATHAQRREIISICQQTDCKLRVMPGIFQLASGEVKIERLRNVEIEDLLGRDSVSVNWNAIAAYVNGKTVLVTGGGGSIGSELCRQVAKHHPRELIIFDIYENNAYAIQQELLRLHPHLNLTVLIGSVRDSARVNSIFQQYAIDLVYHAAAHKHVPLMEDSPAEAVKNNIFGTQNVARAAGENGVKAFVMISTDKAVNPTNVMGASKRVCEMVVQQTAAGFPQTKFVAVRFGNVLGSNGSVIPLFRKQIETGGPVTVTHPDIIRYFMTIPEAVSLVLQAGALAKGGEIFVLDMGDPVRIDDLARNMIRLSGLEPDVDIPIIYTGLRPGEKLYEELLMAEEGLTKTENRMIFIGRQQPVDSVLLTDGLQELRNLGENQDERVREVIRRIVPTYHKQEECVEKMAAHA